MILGFIMGILNTVLMCIIDLLLIYVLIKVFFNSKSITEWFKLKKEELRAKTQEYTLTRFKEIVET